jgi:hypothetical protein
MQIMGYFKLSFIMTELDNLYTNLGAYSELSFIKEGVGVRSCGGPKPTSESNAACP